MNKPNTGLQKGISSIFDGVPLPPKAAADTQNTQDKQSALETKRELPKPSRNYSPPSHLKYQAPERKENDGMSNMSTQQAQQNQNTETFAEKNKTAIKIDFSKWLEKFMPKQKQNKEADGRQKLMVVLIPILAIVAVFVFYNASMSGSSKATTIDKNMSDSPVKASAKLQWEIPDPYPSNTRDPMQFSTVSNSQNTSDSTPVVKGIVYSEDNPSAIVNNQIVRVGDIVNDAVIIAIYKDCVEFKNMEKTWKQKIER